MPRLEVIAMSVNHKWTTKVFFHFIEKAIFNSFISYKKCNAKKRFLQFKLNLIQFILREAPVDADIVKTGCNKYEGCQNLELIPSTKIKDKPQKQCIVCKKDVKRNEKRY